MAPATYKDSFFVFNYLLKEPKMLLTSEWRPSAESGDAEKKLKYRTENSFGHLKSFVFWILAYFSFLLTKPTKSSHFHVLPFSFPGKVEGIKESKQNGESTWPLLGLPD